MRRTSTLQHTKYAAADHSPAVNEKQIRQYAHPPSHCQVSIGNVLHIYFPDTSNLELAGCSVHSLSVLAVYNTDQPKHLLLHTHCAAVLSEAMP